MQLSYAAMFYFVCAFVCSGQVEERTIKVQEAIKKYIKTYVWHNYFSVETLIYECLWIIKLVVTNNYC